MKKILVTFLILVFLSVTIIPQEIAADISDKDNSLYYQQINTKSKIINTLLGTGACISGAIPPLAFLVFFLGSGAAIGGDGDLNTSRMQETLNNMKMADWIIKVGLLVTAIFSNLYLHNIENTKIESCNLSYTEKQEYKNMLNSAHLRGSIWGIIFGALGILMTVISVIYIKI